MDFFYDGQIRRYVTQFMRIFIGFKYQTGDGQLKSVPVNYGDMSRQVAAIIKENSENKMPSVPKIACYITGIDLDRSRLGDATHVSKVHVRERAYEFDDAGEPVYENYQGAGYTVERLMPTPFLLTMRADIWTSNTDQKLQLFEQIAVLFNPSLEVQTTDNYIDWTSLSVISLKTTNFTSRTIPAGIDSEIDICTLDFEMPIWISPPVKVKKLGVVQNIIMNMFSDDGNLKPLSELAFNYVDGPDANPNAIRVTPGEYGVLLLKSNTGNLSDRLYDLSVLNPSEAVTELKLDIPIKHGQRLDWNIVLDQYDGYKAGISQVRFLQPSGVELVGTFVVNDLDPTYLQVEFVDAPSEFFGNSVGIVDAIVNPNSFNPITTFGLTHDDIPNGVRYLILENIGNGIRKTFVTNSSIEQIETEAEYFDVDESTVFVNGVQVLLKQPRNRNGKYVIVLDGAIPEDATVTYILSLSSYGPTSWTNKDGSDFIANANDIIQWSSSTKSWSVSFDSTTSTSVEYVQNLKTMIQYKWEDSQWLKSFEGEYSAGYWSFNINP